MSERELPSNLVTACRAQTAPMLATLSELVSHNSFSRHPEGGAVVAAMLERELRAIEGLDVALAPSQRFAPHVLARSASARDGAAGCVGLVGHHDTVFPPGTFEGFSVDGDIARGPGVLDMKGGLVIVLTALRLLAEAKVDVPLRLVIVSDEEVGSPEGTAVLERELGGASAALVFEAGRAHDAIITARKGTGSVEVTATHDDAVASVARFVNRAQRLTDYERGVTVNVGTISGDGARATALFDLRFVTSEQGDTLVGALHHLAETLDGGLTFAGGLARPPLQRTDANVALFHEYAACAAQAGLGHGEAPLMGGGSDASTTAAMGIPSIDGLGPRGTGFHTRDELIEIPTLTQRLEALVRFLWGRRRP